MKTRPLWGAAALAVAALTVPAAQAATINVDLGGGAVFVGTAAAPDVGTVWNGFTGTGPTVLLNSLGDTSGVTMTSIDNPTFTGYTGVGSTDLTNDLRYRGGSDPVGSITLTGLTIGATYDFYMYAWSNDASHATQFTFASANGGDSGIATSDLAGHMVQLTATADAGGAISFNWERAAGASFGVINGFQVVQVPEPSAALLGGLGLLALLRRRR